MTMMYREELLILIIKEEAAQQLEHVDRYIGGAGSSN